MLTVFYDGECGLCHRWVRILVARDLKGDKFLFAPIGGSYFKSQLPPDKIAGLPDSIVVTDESGIIYTKSAAVSKTLRHIGGGSSSVAKLIEAIPRSVADFFYDTVARVRRRLFAKPTTVCPFMDAEMRRRFRLD